MATERNVNDGRIHGWNYNISFISVEFIWHI